MLKILHTADWHLGKKLEHISRHEEQQQILNDIVSIVNKDNYDLIIIAGDIFDSVNPPAQSEQLFYNTLKKLIDPSRLIVIVSGNHDNSLRLSATQNLLIDDNVLFFEDPFKIHEINKYTNFEIVNSYEGGVVVNFKNKLVAINTLCYPTQTNLNIDFEEQTNYSKIITDILKKQNKKSKDSDYIINVSHLFIGKQETMLGGSLAVDINHFDKVDYTALGHIHKTQIYKDKNVCYSGSILEYRISETNNNKNVIHVEIENGNTEITKIQLRNIKPIIQVDVNSLSSALTSLNNHTNEYVYLTLNTNVPLTTNDKKELFKFDNLISLDINLVSTNTSLEHIKTNVSNEQILKEAFKEINQIEISDDVYKLYEQILSEVTNETT